MATTAAPGRCAPSCVYGLSRAEASDIIEGQVTTVRENWTDVCHLARLTRVESDALFERQILNPYAFTP